MRVNHRAFSIIEVLVAVLVAAMSFFVFLTVFRSSYEHAAHTRNRAVAAQLAKTLLEEVEAHPYGAAQPARWTVLDENPVQVWVQGQPVETRLHKKFSFKNSSFVGNATNANLDTDVVTIAISWREGAGTAQPVTTGASGDNRQLEVKVPVWR